MASPVKGLALSSLHMPTNTHSERHRPLSGPKSNRGSRSTRTERLGQIKAQIVHWHMICLCKLQYLNYKMLNTEQLIELMYPNMDDVGNGTWWHCSWFAYLALFSKDLETTWPSELIRQWLQYLEKFIIRQRDNRWIYNLWLYIHPPVGVLSHRMI